MYAALTEWVMRKRMYLFASIFVISVIAVTALSCVVYREAERTINGRKKSQVVESSCPLCVEAE